MKIFRSASPKVFRNQTFVSQQLYTRYWNIFEDINDSKRKGSWQREGEEKEGKKGFTMEGWARRAAWKAWNRAAAPSLLGCQLLLDLLQACTLLEAAHAVHHPRWHVGADTGLASIGIDGEHVGSATECADHHPATVVAEGDILYLENRARWQQSGQCPCFPQSKRTATL